SRLPRRAGGRERTTSYELLGCRGEVVGQRASLTGKVRGALVVLLIECAARLIEEVFRGPQGFLLGRLQGAPFKLPQSSRDIDNVLLGAIEEPLLLSRRHFRPERACRRGRAGSGRRRSSRFLDDGLVPGATAQEQQRRRRKQEPLRHICTLPDATGSVRIITVPRSTSDSTSIRPSCICTIRYTIESPMPDPCDLVVKYRRKIFSRSCAGMPTPSSAMRISTEPS